MTSDPGGAPSPSRPASGPYVPRKLPRRRSRRRARFLWTLVAVVAGLVVLLGALVGVGYLRLPSAPPPSVTVSQVDWTVLEGTTSKGVGWFGSSSFNYSLAEGFPLTVTAGSSFSVVWTTMNWDTAPHTVSSVSVSSPFTLDRSTPGVPITAAAGEDDVGFSFTVGVPSSASGAYVLDVTVTTS